jgi:peptide/nickel transport system permease protein
MAELTKPPSASKRRLGKYLTLLWKRRTATLGLVILLVLFVTAVFQTQIATHDPTDQNIRRRLIPPVWDVKGNPEFPLGTDQLGRDIFSRLIYGARISLFVGLSGVAVSFAIGSLLGLVSGYYGGKADAIIMRAVDAFLGFPFLLLAITMVVTLGASLTNIILILGFTGWVPFARLVRGQVLYVRELEYVQAARVSGASDKRIMVRHIFPNLVAPVIIYSSMEVGIYIITEASLTFLGMGIPPSIPTWGNMLANGRNYLTNAWWLATFPGIAIVLTVLAFNFMGDWLRDVFDPKTIY